MSQVNEPDELTGEPSASLPTLSTAQTHAIGAALLLLTITFVAYLPAMQGGFIWDDDAHVPRPELRSFAGLMRMWFEPGATQQYYPLSSTVYWIQHKLWGDASLGYHLVNVLFHAANACLLLGILRKLQVPGALLAAAIFAVHPVHVESVAWISEQKNTLSALFYLSAMWVYLGFDGTRKPLTYWFAFALFVLGLLSKSVTATLPAALLVIFWWQRGTLSWQRDIRPLVPFFVVGAVAGLFTAWFEQTHVGAEGTDFDLSLVERFLLACRVPWFYAWKLVWPTKLMFVYPRWTIDAGVAWQWLFPGASLALIAVLCVVARRWRGPLAGVLLFVGALFPVLGFLNVYPFRFSFVADHFQYLASVGLIVLAASGLTLAAGHLPAAMQALAKAAGALLVGTLAFLTWQQADMYGDVVTLYRRTLALNPNAWLVHNNLGVELADGMRVEEAIPHYHDALRLKPDAAEVHYNYANALAAQGKTAEAIAEYREALRLHPDYPQALNNLGTTLSEHGNADAAVELLAVAVKLNPDSPDARYRLGAALMAAGRVTDAAPHLVKAIEIQPDYAPALSSLSSALLQTGNPNEAIEAAAKAIHCQPDYAPAHNNLGAALAQLGRFPEAIGFFETATEHDPNFAQAYGNLMAAYAAAGRKGDAIKAGRKGLAVARSTGKAELAAKIEFGLKQIVGAAPAAPLSPETVPPAAAPQ